MRRIFRLLVLALVLVTVFLVSAMTSMRMAIHGRETVVPKLVGMTAAEAERTAADHGLIIEVQARFYSPDIAEGRIMSQAPAPGTKVRRGAQIRLAQSLGPQRVTIPNVVGQSPRAAELNIVRRGLQVGTVAAIHLPGFPPDQVVAQSPPANAAGVVSPKVNLLQSAPEPTSSQYFVVPDFVGQTYGQARSAIVESGFKVGTVTVMAKDSDQPTPSASNKLRPIATDVITGQSPAPGQKIAAGSAINFEVVR
ncbi:MAG: PASTA domain-containing protein [Terriglobales bacterium]